MIFEFNGFIPVVHPSAFVHPQATVTGNVIIGKNVYIGPSAALRGDWGQIIIEDGCNVQENCTIHMFPGTTTILKAGAHLGHGCIIHGGIIGENSLIGMNSVIMDDCNIGDECIIGALCFVKGEMNKTTVYRILDRLEQDGTIHCFNGKDGLKWYAKCNGCSENHHYDLHPHFQCNNCDKVE